MSSPYRIADVVVVDPRTGAVRAHQDVTIAGDRITGVGPSTGPAGDGDVDGAGRYAVPGFVDMHAHALGQPDPTRALQLMTAFGITGYRQMAGSPDLLARRRAGALDYGPATPRVVALPGMLLTPMNAGTPDAATAEVARQAEQGADFVKAALITPDVLPAAQAEARRHGIPVLGHLPAGVDVRAASRNGFRSIEHIGPGLGVVAGCSCAEEQVLSEQPAGPKLSLPPVSLPFMNRLVERVLRKQIVNPSLGTSPESLAAIRHALDTFDEERARSLARQFAEDGTWNCPTLIRIKTQELCASPEFPADPDLRFMAPQTVRTWRRAAARFEKAFTAEQHEIFAALWATQLRLTRILDEEGVGLLAGTDAVGAAWVVPGASLHDEFDLLAEAGLSPLRVLQTATSEPARFLERDTTSGTIAAGKDADVVLLDADPTTAVANLHTVTGVVVRGRAHSAVDLAAGKDALAGRVS